MEFMKKIVSREPKFKYRRLDNDIVDEFMEEDYSRGDILDSLRIAKNDRGKMIYLLKQLRKCNNKLSDKFLQEGWKCIWYKDLDNRKRLGWYNPHTRTIQRWDPEHLLKIYNFPLDQADVPLRRKLGGGVRKRTRRKSRRKTRKRTNIKRRRKKKSRRKHRRKL